MSVQVRHVEVEMRAMSRARKMFLPLSLAVPPMDSTSDPKSERQRGDNLSAFSLRLDVIES